MNKNFLASLIGPFPMASPPVRSGFYCVSIKDSTQFEMWYWSGSEWSDSDDGLGDVKDPATASGWYGKLQPGDVNLPPDDGLGD